MKSTNSTLNQELRTDIWWWNLKTLELQGADLKEYERVGSQNILGNRKFSCETSETFPRVFDTLFRECIMLNAYKPKTLLGEFSNVFQLSGFQLPKHPVQRVRLLNGC